MTARLALGAALVAALDDDALAELAERLLPHLHVDHDDGLLTTAQAAMRLGLHPKTVERMARDGRLAATKIGGRWRFAPDELDATLPPRSRGVVASSSPRARRDRSIAASVAAIRGPATPTHHRANGGS